MEQHLSWIIPTLVTIVIAILGLAIAAVIRFIQVEGKIETMSVEQANTAARVEEVCEDHENTRRKLDQHAADAEQHLGKRNWEMLMTTLGDIKGRLERMENRMTK